MKGILLTLTLSLSVIFTTFGQIYSTRFAVSTPHLDSLIENCKPSSKQKWIDRKTYSTPKYFDLYSNGKNFIQVKWNSVGSILETKLLSKENKAIYSIDKNSKLSTEGLDWNPNKHLTIVSINSPKNTIFKIEESGAMPLKVTYETSIELPDSILVEKHLNGYPELSILNLENQPSSIQIGFPKSLMTIQPLKELSVDSTQFINFTSNIDDNLSRENFIKYLTHNLNEYSFFTENNLEYRTNGQDTLLILDSYPRFDGSIEYYLSKKIKYPKQSRKDKIQGTIEIEFTVTEVGEIKGIKLTKGINEELNNVALNVVQNMPKWIAGKQNGKSVSVTMKLPITFKL
jgi:TonB family protein